MVSEWVWECSKYVRSMIGDCRRVLSTIGLWLGLSCLVMHGILQDMCKTVLGEGSMLVHR